MLSGLFLLLLWSAHATAATRTTEDDPSSFLPIIYSLPAPTPIPAVPELVNTLELPGAQCPNFVGVNETSGYIYVANNFSNNVSILSETNLVTTVPSGGDWPTKIAADPNSDRIFMTNLHVTSGVEPPSKLAMFRNTGIANVYNQYYEGHTPLYNSYNNYLYVTDLDSDIRVFDAQGSGLTFLTDIGHSQGVNGWITSATFDPDTGLVYAGSWDYGQVHVIDGTQVIATISSKTWGPAALALDRENGYLYVVGQEVSNRPEGYPNYNVTVFNAHPPFQFLGGFVTSNSSISVAWDPIGGYVYVSNPLENSVSVFKGLQHIRTTAVSANPRYLAVHPETGYAFVPSSNGNTITIFKDGQIVKTVANQGVSPWAVGINTVTDYVYVANRGREVDFQCHNASVTILR
ncbi:MAG: hypothetical protein KC413_07435 [Anaerolineales bacterium]|nr:hypothetical protein [Anaerolineales bacterium]